MTAISTLTRKNQTTVPKVIVEALGLKPADQLVYEIEDDHVILRARTGRLADLVNEPPVVPPPKRPFTIEQINTAIGASYAQHGARGTRTRLRK
jgi:AbrB family looped-hinge helix DNA binding protein